MQKYETRRVWLVTKEISDLGYRRIWTWKIKYTNEILRESKVEERQGISC